MNLFSYLPVIKFYKGS